MKIKNIEKSDFSSEEKEKIYMKKGDDNIIEIRKNFHPPKYAKKGEIYIENENNNYIKYSKTEKGCLGCYFQNENKCLKGRRKNCSKEKSSFEKISEIEFLCISKTIDNKFDYLRYSNLKNELKEIEDNEYFILED